MYDRLIHDHDARQEALNLLEMMQAAYHFDKPDAEAAHYINPDRMEAWGYDRDTQIIPIHSDDGQSCAFILKRQLGDTEEVTVMFRGTDQPGDLIYNLDFNLEPDPQGYAIGRTHQGFTAALDAIWDQITPHLAGDNLSIRLGGHSLGGAMAQIAATRLLSDGQAVDDLTIAGAPRALGRRTALQLNEDMRECGGSITRINNRDDPVPKVPPQANGYAHIGNGFYHLNQQDNGETLLQFVPAGPIKLQDQQEQREEQVLTQAMIGQSTPTPTAIDVANEETPHLETAQAQGASRLFRGIEDHLPPNYIANMRENIGRDLTTQQPRQPGDEMLPSLANTALTMLIRLQHHVDDVIDTVGDVASDAKSWVNRLLGREQHTEADISTRDIGM